MAKRTAGLLSLGAGWVFLLLTLRVGAAIWVPLSDVDESMNYWEPAHLLVFGSVAPNHIQRTTAAGAAALPSGDFLAAPALANASSSLSLAKQTWEYAPQYALRSWLFVWLYAAPMYLVQRVLVPAVIASSRISGSLYGGLLPPSIGSGGVFPDTAAAATVAASASDTSPESNGRAWWWLQVLTRKPTMFYGTKVLIALATAMTELYFYSRLAAFTGTKTAGRLALLIGATSAGMLQQAAAFLPSSFAMMMHFLAAGAALDLLSAAWGSPATAAASASMERVFERKVKRAQAVGQRKQRQMEAARRQQADAAAGVNRRAPPANDPSSSSSSDDDKDSGEDDIAPTPSVPLLVKRLEQLRVNARRLRQNVIDGAAATCIWACAIAAILGWPFAALVAAPMALAVLRHGSLVRSVFHAVAAVVVLSTAITIVDTMHYNCATTQDLADWVNGLGNEWADHFDTALHHRGDAVVEEGGATPLSAYATAAGSAFKATLANRVDGVVGKEGEHATTTSAVSGGLLRALSKTVRERAVFSTWNLIKYNTMSTDSGRGPELYGVEPWYFFFMNLTLNFNVAFPLALFAPAVALIVVLASLASASVRTSYPTAARAAWEQLAIASPFLLWFCFWLRVPHKEERFMVPAYPFLIGAAAHALARLMGRNSRDDDVDHDGAAPRKGAATAAASSGPPIVAAAAASNGEKARRALGALIAVVIVLLSAGRVIALIVFYGAPEAVATRVYDTWATEYTRSFRAYLEVAVDSSRDSVTQETTEGRDDVVAKKGGLMGDEARHAASFPKIRTMCVGKEWYRFPGSFFVPPGAQWHFVEASAFGGALPRDFNGSTTPIVARRVPGGDAVSDDVAVPSGRIPAAPVAGDDETGNADFFSSASSASNAQITPEQFHAALEPFWPFVPAAIGHATCSTSGPVNDLNQASAGQSLPRTLVATQCDLVLDSDLGDDRGAELRDAAAADGSNTLVVLAEGRLIDAGATPRWCRLGFMPAFSERCARWGRFVAVGIERSQP